MKSRRDRKTANDVNPLVHLIERLRGKNGCPWDKKQTPQSIAVYLIEEVYELVEAIHSGNPDDICEELGDVLFQVLFIGHLYKEDDHFDLDDVIDRIIRKMVRRHPHVFGDQTVNSADDVKKQWQQIKNNEKDQHGQSSILDTVPGKMPALMRAYRISERAAGAGFDWEDISGVAIKVEEEWDELKDELAAMSDTDKNRDRVSDEFGDLLFTLVNVARFARIHPELSLRDAVKKFEKRFKYMEAMISDQNGSLNRTSPEQFDRLWNTAKKETGSLQRRSIFDIGS